MAIKKGFNSVDKYIDTFPPETQKVLEEIRVTVKAIIHDAKEKISYQIAGFELNGKIIVADLQKAYAAS